MSVKQSIESYSSLAMIFIIGVLTGLGTFVIASDTMGGLLGLGYSFLMSSSITSVVTILQYEHYQRKHKGEQLDEN